MDFFKNLVQKVKDMFREPEFNYKAFVVEHCSPYHDGKHIFVFSEFVPTSACVHIMNLYGEDHGLKGGFYNVYNINPRYHKLENKILETPKRSLFDMEYGKMGHWDIFKLGTKFVDGDRQIGNDGYQWWINECDDAFKIRNMRNALDRDDFKYMMEVMKTEGDIK